MVSIVATTVLTTAFTLTMTSSQYPITWPRTQQLESPFEPRAGEIPGRDVSKAAAAIFRVAMRLQASMGNPLGDTNVLVSPVSVGAVLGQLVLGSRGRTTLRLSEILWDGQDGESPIPGLEYHKQFRVILGMLVSPPPPPPPPFLPPPTPSNPTPPSSPSPPLRPPVELVLASGLFVRNGLRLRADLEHGVRDLYLAGVRYVDYSGDPEGARRTINQWVNNHTRGHIQEVYPHPSSGTTACHLVNVIYFRGAWESPFDPQLTVPGNFRVSPRRHVTVDYMRGEMQVAHVDSIRRGCEMVVLPYKGSSISLYLILPHIHHGDKNDNNNNNNITNLAASLGLQDILDLRASAETRSVTLIIPKMTLRKRFNLKDTFKKFHKFRKQQKNVFQTILPTTTTRRRRRTNNNNNTVVSVRTRDHKLVPNMRSRSHGYHMPTLPDDRIIFPTDGDFPRYAPHRSKHHQDGGKTEKTEESHVKMADDRHQDGHNNKETKDDHVKMAENRHQHGGMNGKSEEDHDKMADNRRQNGYTNKETKEDSNNMADDVRQDGDFKHKTKDDHDNMADNRHQNGHNDKETKDDHKMADDHTNQDDDDDDDFQLDFSGFSDDSRFTIDDILHEVWLEVTETGTEAAAVTSGAVYYSGDVRVFHLNRPFLFLVLHEASRAAILWGSVTDPTAGPGSRAGDMGNVT